MLSLLYQESGCVVQEAAKATAEASFQEGGVLWRDVLRQQAHRAAGSVTAGLSACRQKRKTVLLFHAHPRRSKSDKPLCVWRPVGFLLSARRSFSPWLRAKCSWHLNISLSSVWTSSNTLWWTTSDWWWTGGVNIYLSNNSSIWILIFRVWSHSFTWWKPRKSWMVGDV